MHKTLKDEVPAKKTSASMTKNNQKLVLLKQDPLLDNIPGTDDKVMPMPKEFKKSVAADGVVGLLEHLKNNMQAKIQDDLDQDAKLAANFDMRVEELNQAILGLQKQQISLKF